MHIKEQFETFIHQLQDELCLGFESFEPHSRFIEDLWKREEGGGGITRILSGGEVFEKAGVNTSVVHGKVPRVLINEKNKKATHFYACGLSMVIHPVNPFVPTTHANIRYFALYNAKGEKTDSWFGGGLDLTPYYRDMEDIAHFHFELKKACDKSNPTYYPLFKKQCDQYFYNSHRSEARGVGGVFFDHLRPDQQHNETALMQFTQNIGSTIAPAYFPLIKKNKDAVFNSAQKEWQEIRRGRYVEFNLLHDRGTEFGLKSNGRTESILMSLPPLVRWEYRHEPEVNSPEYQLLELLKHPIDYL